MSKPQGALVKDGGTGKAPIYRESLEAHPVSAGIAERRMPHPYQSEAGPLRQLDGRAGGGDHEHAVVGTKDLIVDVDTNDGIGPELAGPVGHLIYGL